MDAVAGQLRLLGQHMVELGHVENVSNETIRQTKKNELKPWQNKEWCIPAKENAEFVCAMEDVLDVYKRSYDDTHPLVCMDESSKQHINPYLAHFSDFRLLECNNLLISFNLKIGCLLQCHNS